MRSINISSVKEFNSNLMRIHEDGLNQLEESASREIPVTLYDDLADYKFDISNNVRYKSVDAMNKIGVTKQFDASTCVITMDIMDSVTANLEEYQPIVRATGPMKYEKVTTDAGVVMGGALKASDIYAIDFVKKIDVSTLDGTERVG